MLNHVGDELIHLNKPLIGSLSQTLKTVCEKAEEHLFEGLMNGQWIWALGIF